MSKSGTGLGLAIVWNSVQDHNGRIFVKSSKQRTRFQIYLPESTENTVQKISEKKENLKRNGEHILVIDNDPQLRDIASLILTEMGYKVASVSSGESAIQYVKDTPVDILKIF